MEFLSHFQAIYLWYFLSDLILWEIQSMKCNVNCGSLLDESVKINFDRIMLDFLGKLEEFTVQRVKIDATPRFQNS